MKRSHEFLIFVLSDMVCTVDHKNIHILSEKEVYPAQKIPIFIKIAIRYSFFSYKFFNTISFENIS